MTAATCGPPRCELEGGVLGCAPLLLLPTHCGRSEVVMVQTLTLGTMERLYMETQDGLKSIALTLFLNLFFHFLPAAALCDDCSLVDSVET